MASKKTWMPLRVLLCLLIVLFLSACFYTPKQTRDRYEEILAKIDVTSLDNNTLNELRDFNRQLGFCPLKKECKKKLAELEELREAFRQYKRLTNSQDQDKFFKEIEEKFPEYDVHLFRYRLILERAAYARFNGDYRQAMFLVNSLDEDKMNDLLKKKKQEVLDSITQRRRRENEVICCEIKKVDVDGAIILGRGKYYKRMSRKKCNSTQYWERVADSHCR